MTKRVLIITVGYYPHVGGSEVAIREVTRRIDPHDVSFDMVTLRFISKNAQVEKVENITVHRIGCVDDRMKSTDTLPFRLKAAKFFFPFTAFMKMRSLHKARPYDMVWVNMANHGAFAALLFKRFFPNVPYVLMLQDGQTIETIRRKNPLLRLFSRLYVKVFTAADRIYAISNFTKDLARSMGATCPIELIPNGVDVRHFSAPPSPKECDDVRSRLSLKKDASYLITTSRLVMNRGVEDVIVALRHLPSHVEFLVLGVGNDLEKLRMIAKEHGVLERVHFVGHVDHRDLPAYLHIADVFVRPSIVEGFGNSFIEAMAAGIPVVATRVGGIPDFLYDPDDPDRTHAPTGLFCGVHDPKSVADKVLRILNEPALADMLRKNASAMVSERYDWDTIARSAKERLFDVI